MSKKTPKYDMNNYDNDGNLIPAFPVSEQAQKDKFKTSVGYTLVSVLLYLLAIAPIIALSVVLALKCYDLVPYYGFWNFIGVVLAGVLMLVFVLLVIGISRPHSKHSIRNQTAKLAIAYTCLTCVFGILMTYVFPDVIAMATQGTLKTEDLYYLNEEQAEENAALERDFIMYNLLIGNVNEYDETGAIVEDYSYYTLSKRVEDSAHVFLNYENDEIQASYEDYLNTYGSSDDAIAQFETYVLNPLEKKYPRQYELYEFIYNSYVLCDADYCFYNNFERRAFCMALTDYELRHSDYEKWLKEGFVLEGSNPKLHDLFVNNYDSFNQDGYLTFDDELLLIAQMNRRMGVPAIVRLILNEGWDYTTESNDGTQIQYTEEGNFLYELYSPETKDAFEAAGGTYTYTDTLMNNDGTTYEINYGYNEDGWKIYENGLVHRPITWIVLDMLGDPMPLVTLDLADTIDGLLPGMGETVIGIVDSLLTSMPGLVDSLGGLVFDDLKQTLYGILDGGSLNIQLCVDDNGMLAVNLVSTNVENAMLGYMQATWVSSDNLLYAVINVMSLRNWASICGAIGLICVIAAGVLREAGRKTRDRSEISIDKILRDRAMAETAATGNPGEVEVTPDELDAIGIKKKKKGTAGDMFEENENYEYDYKADFGNYEDYDIKAAKKAKKEKVKKEKPAKKSKKETAEE